MGSSRRAPGQQELVLAVSVRAGFIPACAGAAAPGSPSTTRSWVHPGVRRGSVATAKASPGLLGSSRRAPGQPPLAPTTRPNWRFIPACAGAAKCRNVPTPLFRVHPGVRRGSLGRKGSAYHARGSSRRAPGQHRPVDPDREPVGFIPACAGAASTRCARSGRTWVHPGVRRGSAPAQQVGGWFKGSSRRAPGQQDAVDRHDALHGFIPACAGAAPAGRDGAGDHRVHPGVRRGSCVLDDENVCVGGSSRRAPGQPAAA